jgi:hypothetical protein
MKQKGYHYEVYHINLYLAGTINQPFVGFYFATCISLSDLRSHSLEDVEGKGENGVL